MHHAIAPYGQYSAAYCRRPDLMRSWEFQILRMIIENSVCTSAVVIPNVLLRSYTCDYCQREDCKYMNFANIPVD